MEIVFLIIVAVVVIVFYSRISNKLEEKKIKQKKAKAIKPVEEQKNDKIVVVRGTQDNVNKAITEFVKLYNQEKYQALPRLYTVSSEVYIITFPYDISFEIFCYFVNFMHYPLGLDKGLEVIGWTTTPDKDDFVKEEYKNTKGMFFVPNEDEEGDNVYMTTVDGKGHKIGFSLGDLKPLEYPKKQYQQPQYTFEHVVNHTFKDFE
jgi:hypothetical protein